MKTVSTAKWATGSKELLALIAAADKCENGKLNNDQIQELAKQPEFKGYTVPSIRSKAVSESLYQKADEPRKVGNPSARRKIETVNAIETILSMSKGSLDSLEKGSKQQLEALADQLVKLSDQQSANKGE